MQTTLPPRILAVLLAFSACQEPAPPTLSTCPDSPCMEAWLAQHPGLLPGQVAPEVVSISDPVRQAMAMDVLFRTVPAVAAQICPKLSESNREACNRRAERPHLFREPVAEPSTPGAMAAPSLLQSLSQLPSPWTGPATPVPECGSADAEAPRPGGRGGGVGDNEARMTCIVRASLPAPTLEEQAARCLSLEPGKWRDECFFLLSEAAFSPGRPQGSVGSSARLCLGSGPFLVDCVFHLMSAVQADFSRDQEFREPTWRRLAGQVEELEVALSATDPALGRWASSLLWARCVASAYSRLQVPTGLPVTWVGESVRPHVRAAVAHTLWLRETRRPADLDGWARRVEEALASQDQPLPAASAYAPVTPRAGWTQVLPGEEALEQVPWMGMDIRRTTSPDPVTDAVICVLEAAARLPGDERMALLKQALEHPDRLVRWTAARLMAEERIPLSPDMSPSAEQDPLVRARLDTAMVRPGAAFSPKRPGKAPKRVTPRPNGT